MRVRFEAILPVRVRDWSAARAKQGARVKRRANFAWAVDPQWSSAQHATKPPAITTSPRTAIINSSNAAAGERVVLAATIVDPNGWGFDAHWKIAMNPSGYAGAQDLSLCQECAVDAAFILPADARPGE